MDSVPFTLFFMVCLMGFCGILALPHAITPVGVWPEWCAERTYCFTKPIDYPSPEEIQELFRKTDLVFSQIQQPSFNDRVAVNDCKYFLLRDTIYMIKDDNDRIRYVMQDPGVFRFITEVVECKPDQEFEDLAHIVQCKTKYDPIKLPVLSLNKSLIELVNIKRGLPVSCRILTRPGFE